LVFSNLGDSPLGILQGQGDFGGVSAFLPGTSGNSTLVGFQYQDNFINVAAAVSENEVTSSIDYFDSDASELVTKAESKILEASIGGTEYLLVAAETESRQIVLYFFQSGNLMAVEYVGYINPYDLGDMTLSESGDLYITGTFYVNSRFPRPFIRKYAARELQSIVVN
jgi:hypothetical protein